MTTIAPETTLKELVAERPLRARVFERLGIDFFCSGNRRSLAEACRQHNLDVDSVTALLDAPEKAANGDTDWTQAPLGDLVDNIVVEHHGYLREALPRLTLVSTKVAGGHGKNHPELLELKEVFAGFRMDLEAHMAKEERVLFPLIKAMEDGRMPAGGFVGSVAAPIQCMEAEHADAENALSVMRQLTDGFALPDDACNGYKVLMTELAALEADMSVHIYKENEVLFPRSMSVERTTTAEVW